LFSLLAQAGALLKSSSTVSTITFKRLEYKIKILRDFVQLIWLQALKINKKVGNHGK